MSNLPIFRQGPAVMVILQPSDEFIDHAEVIVYENGMVSIVTAFEDITTHISSCEILWTHIYPEDGTPPRKLRALPEPTSKEPA